MHYASIAENAARPSSALEETKRLRTQAQQLIDLLRHAKQETEERLQADEREDAMTTVRGRSSFDDAIASVEHSRDVLDRALKNTSA